LFNRPLYDISIWEEIRSDVGWKINRLVDKIQLEIPMDSSLSEFQGNRQVCPQLRQILEQRADNWVTRVYALCCDASTSKPPSADFDRAMWMYCIEPFVMREKEADIHTGTMSGFLELLLCAVGSTRENRRFLTVNQKNCCIEVRIKIYQTWDDKLHHRAPRIDEAVAAMVRSRQSEIRAARIVEGLPADPPTPQPTAPFPVPLSAPTDAPPALTANPNNQPPAGAQPNATGVPQSQTVETALTMLENTDLPSLDLAHKLKRQEVANNGKPAQAREVATWSTIDILFLSDERVQVRTGTNRKTLNYAEFGFEDRRTGTPNQAWQILRALAEQNGVIRDGRALNLGWPKVEKRIQEIRRVLREHFGITADPIPFIENGGYQARFKIGCAPSFHT